MSPQLEVKKAICMWCHCHCAVSVYVRDGRLEKIEEAKEHPQRESLAPVVRSCARAQAAAEWFYHPDRLSFPLKRAGERGQGKWQKISWDQALDEIADKLREIKEKYGAEAVASTEGTGRAADEYRLRFLNLFGTPNLPATATICFAPSDTVACAILGWGANRMSLGPETKCMLMIGANPEQSRRRTWLSMLETKKRGAKFIVVDPRRTVAAEMADLWLQLRPGTDAALLMSLIGVIIKEGLYDKQFVDQWCHGFDQLARRAQGYPPEKVAEITWVPAPRIVEAARMYATNRPAATYSYMGLEQTTGSIPALHARFILSAITGNIDIAGGNLLYGPPNYVTENEIELNHLLSPEQQAKNLGADRFRLYSHEASELIEGNVERVWGKRHSDRHRCMSHYPTVIRAIISGKPYPVRAMLTSGHNPLVAQPNTKLVYKALKSLELSVVNEFWLTPTAELADYVMPIASWLERPHIYTAVDSANGIDAGEAALPSRKEGDYDRRPDYDFWRGLGMRLGQEQYWPWATLEAALDWRLKPLGYNSIKEFIAKEAGYHFPPVAQRKYKKMGFATPTGKVELYSTILEKLGYDPLPHYQEPAESPLRTPELAKQYPLILISGGRFLPMYHSEHRQIDSLRRQHPHPIVQLNPEKAKELGIAQGDWVWIESPRGRAKLMCQLFTGIDPRVVHAEHGWWLPELPGEEPWLHGVWESNINVVTDDDPDHCSPVSGAWPFRAELCKIYKAKTY